MKRSSCITVIGALLGLGLAACTVAPGEDPSASASEALGIAGSGFAWINDRTSGVDPSYAFDSVGGAVTYSHDATGVFTVRFPNIGVNAGDVQVSSYGFTNERCHTVSWGAEGSTLAVHVACERPGGAAADSSFSVAYVNDANNQGLQGAYVWSGAPASAYAWNSTGATNSVTHVATGVYGATLPGIDFADASVHVTAYGSSAHYCNVGSWSAGVSGASVAVDCFDANGNPADGEFTLSYLSNAMVAFHVGGHAWVSSPTSAPSAYQSSGPILACGAPGAVTVSKPGNYDVHFSEVVNAPSSNAMVSAYGSTPNYCKIVSWLADGTDAERVNVACFDKNGASTTSPFDVTFTSSTWVGPC